MADWPLAIALQLVQPEALQRAQVLERLGDVQCQQEVDGGVEIQAREAVRMLALPDFAARGVAP
jgi:hypothetical protein